MELKWIIYFIVVLAVLLIVGITISVLLLKSLLRSSENAFFIDDENQMHMELTRDLENILPANVNVEMENNRNNFAENELVLSPIKGNDN